MTNRAETTVGAPGVPGRPPVVVVVSPGRGAPCPATGRPVPADGPGAVVIAGALGKKKKYVAAPSPRTTITMAAMIRVRCIVNYNFHTHMWCFDDYRLSAERQFCQAHMFGKRIFSMWFVKTLVI